jgi:transcriptional regulator with GAF, ATPase, and Fis domain
MPQVAEAGPEELQTALSLVARAIADSLELKEVFGRVADACRVVVPFEGMGVSRLEAGSRVRVYSTAGDAAGKTLEELVFERIDYSPRLRHVDENRVVLVEDAKREMDPSFTVDRRMLERGYRSLLRLPLLHRGQVFGSLVLVSRRPGVFTEEHGKALAVVAELVALALAHENLASAWRERRERRDALERLLPALARTLDVREVFEEISQIAQAIIPHDYLSLGLLSEDRRRVRIIARFGTDTDALEMPEYIPSPDEVAAIDWEYFLARDHTVLGPNLVRAHLVRTDPSRPSTVDMHLDDAWMRGYTELGVRSTIRAPIRRQGVPVGGLGVMSRQPDRYTEEDAEFAVRVAEHVALALAHQEMAEGSRRTAAAQDRAVRLEERVHALSRELQTLDLHRVLGDSRRWRDVLAQAAKVAPTETTVLLTGESGTGKEVVARYLHRGSSRKDGPFVALNCAALPEQLLESELFGHEKGAFTGALATWAGKIEQAAGGVLFLDEVGEMSPAVQAKFLRVLQEREYQRLGGTRTLKADVRVLAATNRNLRAAISQGTFREDLYYRLAVFDIPLPPLRERPDDILLLADAFLEDIGRSVGTPAAGFSEQVRQTLVAYAWPGNVRELRNAVERAVILCEGGLITSEHLPVGVVSTPRPDLVRPAASAPVLAPPTLDAAEREMITQALARAGHNKSKAARLLGLTRAQLRSRLEKHGLARED